MALLLLLTLLNYAKGEMRYVRARGDIGALQLNRFNAKALKQADAAAKQDRDEIDMDSVEQPGLEELLCDVWGSDRHIFVPGGLFGLANGAFNAIGNEDKR